MDPVTLVIIATLFTLATGGATTAALRRRRRQQARQKIREHLQYRRPLADGRLGLFDMFWDLGANEFALELMAHHSLLPTDASEDELLGTWSRHKDLVESHGSYGEFLSDSLEAIQEFYAEGQYAGHRRRLPNLSDASRRTIPVPRRLDSDKPRATALSERDRSSSGDHLNPVPDADDVAHRRTLRTAGTTASLYDSAPSQAVDLDTVGQLKPMEILQSVFEGTLGNRLEQWWKMRRLRQLKADLDESLSRLYRFYADTARRHPDFYKPLYDARRRWQDETTRLRFAARRRRWAGSEFAMSADILFELAIELADQLATSAYRSTYQVIETIHDHARRGDHPMAGYLVYLNRHAFFAGRHRDYSDLCRDVDYATHRVREEVVKLRDQGVI